MRKEKKNRLARALALALVGIATISLSQIPPVTGAVGLVVGVEYSSIINKVFAVISTTTHARSPAVSPVYTHLCLVSLSFPLSFPPYIFSLYNMDRMVSHTGHLPSWHHPYAPQHIQTGLFLYFLLPMSSVFCHTTCAFSRRPFPFCAAGLPVCTCTIAHTLPLFSLFLHTTWRAVFLYCLSSYLSHHHTSLSLCICLPFSFSPSF